MLSKSPCRNCGSTSYTRWQMVFPEEKPPYEHCSECSKIGAKKLNEDIYKGDCNKGVTTDPNICDPKTGKEIPYSSAGEKAAIMKQLGIRQAESAERNHGSRNEVTRRSYSIG